MVFNCERVFNYHDHDLRQIFDMLCGDGGDVAIEIVQCFDSVHFVLCGFKKCNYSTFVLTRMYASSFTGYVRQIHHLGILTGESNRIVIVVKR